MCKRLKTIKPIITLVHEFAGCVIEEGEDALFYIEKIQNDLYRKVLIP